MKKGILVLIDLEENPGGLLDYTFALAEHLKLEVHLLNCYPKATYNRKFDFANVNYEKGIIGLLREMASPYFSTTKDASLEVKYIAAVGSQVDYVAKNSQNFDVILMRTQIFRNSINKFLNSNIPYLSDVSQCPILIVPPFANFISFENCWFIERKNSDREIVNRATKILNIDHSKLKVKHFNQNKYSSNLWKLLNSKIDFKSFQTRNMISKELENEKVDLILLASYTQDGFQAFMNVSLAKVIFQLGIPIIISHKN